MSCRSAIWYCEAECLEGIRRLLTMWRHSILIDTQIIPHTYQQNLYYNCEMFAICSGTETQMVRFSVWWCLWWNPKLILPSLSVTSQELSAKWTLPSETYFVANVTLLCAGSETMNVCRHKGTRQQPSVRTASTRCTRMTGDCKHHYTSNDHMKRKMEKKKMFVFQGD